MKTFKNLLFLLILSLFTFVITGCGTPDPELLVVNNEIELNEGETFEVTYTVVNLEGSNLVKITVDNEDVLKLEGNKVTALKAGTANINLSLKPYPDVTQTIKVTVNAVPSLSIDGPTKLYLGTSVQLNAVLTHIDDVVIWSVDNNSVASITEDGLLKANNLGEATVTAVCGDYTATLHVEVVREPRIIITGKTVVNVKNSVTLTAELQFAEGDLVWTSSDSSIATVEDGVVTGISKGEVTITCAFGEFKSEVVMKVTEDSEIIYDFDGGTSEELYAQNEATGAITLNNFNYKEGAFWSNNNWERFVFISDASHDPTATFSDRIYIGKNEYTGFYEVIQFLQTGGSSWPKGAEYVITLSNSHNSFFKLHDLIRNVQVGDICFIDKDITTISKANPSDIRFYSQNLESDKLVVKSEDYKGQLVTPVKLGATFEGWYDEEGNKVTEISVIDKVYYLKAKWNVLNPVTDIVLNDFPTTVQKGDKFQINAKVSPSDAFFQEIIFASSDTDVFTVSDTGEVKTVNTGKATLTIRDYASQVIKTFEITVKAVPSIDVKFNHEFNGILNVNDTLTLEPTFLGEGEVSFSYVSSNSEVLTVDEAGVVKAINNGNAEITIKATADKAYTLTVGLTVDGLTNTDKATELLNLLAKNNFGTVETGNMSLYNDGKERYYQTNYGSVNKFLFDTLKPNTDYVQKAVNNTNCHKDRRPGIDTIEFVTVHDTATLTGTVEGIANNMSSNETSIHYTVGNGKVYQVVPEEYIAYHAGDGTRVKFAWTDSGVKAKGNEKPDFDLVKEGNTYYLVLNGTKTNLVVPTTNGDRAIENPTKDHFCDLKPVYTIKNGTYHIGPMWACFSQTAAGAICSLGGNNNSIGIEMCVNTTSDMYDTLQRTAMLVADIMIRNNLGMERVQKHNSWSGKNCPQVERSGDYWANFMEMVQLQYTVRKEYSDATITMKSNNPDIVSNTGRVIKAPLTTTTVSYEITVTVGGVTKSMTLYSVIPGTTVWQQWNGVYPASKIWNNGKYVR